MRGQDQSAKFKIMEILKSCRKITNDSQRYSLVDQNQISLNDQNHSVNRRISFSYHSSIQQMNKKYSRKANCSISQLETKRKDSPSLDLKQKTSCQKKEIKFPVIFAKYKSNYKPRNASLSQKTFHDIHQKQDSQQLKLKAINQANAFSYLKLIREKKEREENSKLVVLRRIWLQNTKKQNKLFCQKIKASRMKRLGTQ